MSIPPAADLYQTGATGEDRRIARVRPLADGCFEVEPLVGGFPRALLGEAGNGFFPGLPYFLADHAPQGFLGRRIVAALAAADPYYPVEGWRWGDAQLWRYWLDHGDDLPGAYKLGERFAGISSPSATLRTGPAIPVTEADYPHLVDLALPPGRQDGEQPKFAVVHVERGPVLVKTAGTTDAGDPLGRRNLDVLITEQIANETLRRQGIRAAETRLVEVEGRLFLESLRFDRNGEQGRLPMISLDRVNAEFVGRGRGGWHRVMVRLQEGGWVAPEAVRQASILDAFAWMIGNEDAHRGNLSLCPTPDGFALLPVYDMCAMGYSPFLRGGSELPPLVSPIPPRAPATDAERVALEIAEAFWMALADEGRISSEMRALAERAAADCRAWL